jgi:hypothetical protein
MGCHVTETSYATMRFPCAKIGGGLFDHIVSYSRNYEGGINIRLHIDKQRSAIF